MVKIESSYLLDLGGGNRPHPDASVVVDSYNIPKDNFKRVKWDLNKFPYPFKDNSFDIVYMSHVLEHLKDPVKVLEEMHRIARKKVWVLVPHYSSHACHNHITHLNYFGAGSMLTFVEGLNPDAHGPAPKWKGELEIKLHYSNHRKYLMWMSPLVDPIINLRPISFERYLLPLAWGGVDELEIIFKKYPQFKQIMKEKFDNSDWVIDRCDLTTECNYP